MIELPMSPKEQTKWIEHQKRVMKDLHTKYYRTTSPYMYERLINVQDCVKVQRLVTDALTLIENNNRVIENLKKQLEIGMSVLQCISSGSVNASTLIAGQKLAEGAIAKMLKEKQNVNEK